MEAEAGRACDEDCARAVAACACAEDVDGLLVATPVCGLDAAAAVLGIAELMKSAL